MATLAERLGLGNVSRMTFEDRLAFGKIAEDWLEEAWPSLFPHGRIKRTTLAQDRDLKMDILFATVPTQVLDDTGQIKARFDRDEEEEVDTLHELVRRVDDWRFRADLASGKSIVDFHPDVIGRDLVGPSNHYFLFDSEPLMWWFKDYTKIKKFLVELMDQVILPELRHQLGGGREVWRRDRHSPWEVRLTLDPEDQHRKILAFLNPREKFFGASEPISFRHYADRDAASGRYRRI